MPDFSPLWASANKRTSAAEAAKYGISLARLKRALPGFAVFNNADENLTRSQKLEANPHYRTSLITRTMPGRSMARLPLSRFRAATVV